MAVGIPKTGFPTERMAHVAARNIAAQIRGEQPTAHKAFGDIPAVCVMDAGNNGVIILADKMLPPRKHGVLIPGPQSPRDEDRLREVLPVEGPPWLCQPPLNTPACRSVRRRPERDRIPALARRILRRRAPRRPPPWLVEADDDSFAAAVAGPLPVLV